MKLVMAIPDYPLNTPRNIDSTWGTSSILVHRHKQTGIFLSVD